MRFAPEAQMRGLSPNLAAALVVVEGVFRQLDLDPLVTSGSNGEHSRASLHYGGAALDFRLPSRLLTEGGRVASPGVDALVAGRLAQSLGPEFDVVLEPTHIHVEYQPKGRAR